MNEGPPTSVGTTTKQANTSRKVKTPRGVGGKTTVRTASGQLLARYAMVIVFGVVFASFALTLPGLFLTVGNLGAGIDGVRSGEGGYPGLACGEHDEGVEEAAVMLGGGG